MLDAYLYDGVRTPFGRYAGALAGVRPDDLAAHVIRTLAQRWPVDELEDVVLGCACQAGEDSRNVGRHAALLAGLPATIAGQTVNRLCGSGLAAVVDCARAVSAGEGQLYIAGGVESMSRAPFVVGKAHTAYSREFDVHDSTIGSRFPNPRLGAMYGDHSMPETADNVAADLGIERAAADRFAVRSQSRYRAACEAGFFAGEIVPVEVPQGRRPPILVGEDEHPRPDTTEEAVSRLRTLSAGGVTTAANASGVNDGAVALLIGSRTYGDTALARPPLARTLATAVGGIEPRVMGLGPVEAIRRALQRADLQLADMDLIEINEAFAAQVLGCLVRLGVDADDPRVNPNGGAIAIGHPLGASGARLLLTAARELQRRRARYAVVSLCIGVGQGIAAVIERAHF